MKTITDYMQFQPGPCSMCGATNYPLSFGGANICPACDCGVSPEVSRLSRELANRAEIITKYGDHVEKQDKELTQLRQLRADKSELIEGLQKLLDNFVTAEAYPEFIDNRNNDRFIDMASAETVARALIAKHTKL